jgi:hypothetical protein
VIAYPKLVIDGIDQGVKVDADKALESLMQQTPATPALPGSLEPPAPASAPAGLAPAAPTSGGLPAPAPAPAAQEDPMKALLEAVKDDANKKK